MWHVDHILRMRRRRHIVFWGAVVVGVILQIILVGERGLAILLSLMDASMSERTSQ